MARTEGYLTCPPRLAFLEPRYGRKGARYNRSLSDDIFGIFEIFEKSWQSFLYKYVEIRIQALLCIASVGVEKCEKGKADWLQDRPRCRALTTIL